MFALPVAQRHEPSLITLPKEKLGKAFVGQMFENVTKDFFLANSLSEKFKKPQRVSNKNDQTNYISWQMAPSPR